MRQAVALHFFASALASDVKPRNRMGIPAGLQYADLRTVRAEGAHRAQILTVIVDAQFLTEE